MKNRIFDLFFSISLLLVTSPILLFIATILKLTSHRSVIFRQQRLGLNKVPFVIYKFRTLVDVSEFSEDAIKTNEDPRITRFGRLLRQTHLDELPQLWNVIRGDMRLVGPRPLQNILVGKRTLTLPCYDNRFRVKPGLTGLVQIKGRIKEYSMGPSKSLRLEMFYIQKQNILFDLSILLHTMLVVLRRKGI